MLGRFSYFFHITETGGNSVNSVVVPRTFAADIEEVSLVQRKGLDFCWMSRFATHGLLRQEFVFSPGVPRSLPLHVEMDFEDHEHRLFVVPAGLQLTSVIGALERSAALHTGASGRTTVIVMDGRSHDDVFALPGTLVVLRLYFRSPTRSPIGLELVAFCR